MTDQPKPDRLDLRGTLDLIFQAVRTAGTANATGALTAGASYRFFADKPDLQWALKHLTLLFLVGVLTFAVSYLGILLTTIAVDQSLALGGSAARAEWEDILWAQPQPPTTAAKERRTAQRFWVIALLFGALSAVCFLVGLGWVMTVVLFL
jgi:hypothetical protein